jgi:hypothetical protein
MADRLCYRFGSFHLILVTREHECRYIDAASFGSDILKHRLVRPSEPCSDGAAEAVVDDSLLLSFYCVKRSPNIGRPLFDSARVASS